MGEINQSGCIWEIRYKICESLSLRGMMRLGPISMRRFTAQAVLSCLLAGLVLTMSFPAPASLPTACGNAMRLPEDSQDSLPDDTESPEGGISSVEFGLLALVQRRSPLLSALGDLRAPRFPLPWTVLTACRPHPWWLIRFDTGADRAGHFLVETRSLRLWLQTQTC
jgi:hypothetical protein